MLVAVFDKPFVSLIFEIKFRGGVVVPVIVVAVVDDEFVPRNVIMEFLAYAC